jgi:aspartate racemase
VTSSPVPETSPWPGTKPYLEPSPPLEPSPSPESEPLLEPSPSPESEPLLEPSPSPESEPLPELNPSPESEPLPEPNPSLETHPAPAIRRSPAISPSPAIRRSPEIIGILGGMGPAATADFYAKLVSTTPGASDQDHLRTVIWSDPTIPDRTEALLGDGPDPTPWLLDGSRVLREAGATVIAIPCNTAHAFVPRIADHVGLPIVHMIDEVAQHLGALSPRIHTAGLLATTGTVRAHLYQEWLDSVGIRLVLPGTDSQDREVMAGIRAVKAGDRDGPATALLTRAARRLTAQGAQAVIAGCTEIPLGLPADAVEVPLVDPALVLARALVRRAGAKPTPREAA